jgi:hypothetical protein
LGQADVGPMDWKVAAQMEVTACDTGFTIE